MWSKVPIWHESHFKDSKYVAGSLFVDIFVTNTDLQTNPNTNLIIRLASLFAFTLAAVGPYLPSNVLLPPSTHIHYIIVARVEISLKAQKFKSDVRACRLTKAKGPDSNHEGNRLGQHWYLWTNNGLSNIFSFTKLFVK